MDATKRKTLIEWVNSLAVAESIESLRQLQDGRHVLALTNLVEGIPQQSDIESNEKRWELILNFLEGLYQCSMTGKIDPKAILYNCHEFEISKVCLLVISAAMLCERNTVFVDRAMRMEVELQHEIRDMVEWVIQPNQNLADLDPSFHHVLAKRLDLCAYDMKDLNPQASSTPQSCNQRSRTAQSSSTPTMNRVQQAGIGTTPVFSTSILGRFTSPGPNQTMSPMSPVQQMVQSPNMANKIRIQQKEQRIKLLERELNAKKHLVAEYESEIEEKRKDADFKEKSLIESREKLQQALKRITQLQANVDDLQSQDVSMQQGPDYERMHLIRNENAELTQRNKQLEEENGGLYNQLHSTQGQVDQLESTRQKMLDYQARLHASDRDLCTLRVALDEKNQLIAELSEATERAHSELTALRDTHRHELLDMHSQLERAAGAMVGAGESLGVVMEIKYTEELEALKSEMNEYEQKLQDKAGHVLELLTRNEELSNEKSEMSTCKVQLLGQVEQLSNSLKITQQNLSQSLETSALWEQKTHVLETTLEEVQNTSTARIADLESQISESQQENLSHLKQLAASHEAVNNLQNAMQSAHESFAQQKKSLSAQIQNSEMEMAKLEEALRSTEGSLRCKQDEVNAVKGELQNTQETFTRELQSKEVMNTSLQGQLQSLEEKLCATHRDLSQQLQHKDAVLRDLTSEFESKKAEFASMYEQMEHQLMEQKSTNEHLDAELSMKKQEVENMQHKSEEDHQCYRAQRSELEEQLKSKSEELTQVVGFRAQDMEEHQVQRITLEQNLNSAQHALHVKETTLEEIKTALDEAESRVLKLEEDVKENTRITENEKQELLQQLQMAEKTWDLTRAELEGSLQNKTDVLSQAKQAMAQQNEEHQTRVDALLQNLSSAQSILESKENALVELENKLSVAESKVSRLEDELKQHEQISVDQKQELSRQLEMATMSGDEQRETVQRLSLQLQEASMKVEVTDNALEALRNESEDREKMMLQQNEEHQTRTAALSQDLSSAQCTLESKENALMELDNKLSVAESKISRLEDEVKQHERISADQKQELSRQLEMATMSGDEQRETVQRLSLQLQEASMKVEVTDNALEALRNESEDREKMMLQQNEEHQTRTAALSQDLSSAQCTLESKENALEMATMSGDEQRETVQRLSLQLQEASMKVEVTENALEALRNESEEKEQQWNAKVDEFERTVGEIYELRQQLQESEVELRQMGDQLDEVSMQLSDTEKTRDAFMTRVQELDLVVKNLNSQLMESETLSEEEKTRTGRLTGQLKALEQEKSQIRQELDGECERVEAMEMELMESQQAFEMKEQELDGKLEETCLANESLQSEVVNMRARTQAMEEQFELQNQKMTKLCDSLKQLGSLDQQRQKELASAIEIRQQVVEDLEEAQFRITTLQEELEESKERNASLELSIQQQKENADAFEARLKEFMDDKEGEMSTLEVELTDYDDKLREAKAQVAEYKAHCDNAQTLIQSLQMELADNINKVASLEESLTVAQEALFNTEKEKEMAEQHLMQSRTSLCGKEDHLGAMQEKVAKLKEELEASAERVKELQDTLSIYEQKSADWERKHHDAETEAERKEMKLESDLERAEEEIEELKNKIALLERNHSEAMGRLNQEGLALKEARLNESTLRQELHATRMELSTKHETLHTMEVHQAGQIEQVVTEGHAVLRGYEQKISDVQEQAKAACQQYETQIQELHSVLKQTQAVAEEKVTSCIEEMTKLKQEQKEEVKVLGRQIEALSSELQSLRCWEISERTSIKELEAKCDDMEQQLAKSHKENVVLSLKLQSTEKELGDLEGDQLGEKTILTEQIESIKQLETELAGVKMELMNAEVQYTEEVKKLESEWKEKLTALEDQKQQALEQYQQVAQELEETHNELENAKRDHAEELLDLEERCGQMQEIMENQAQRSSETASDQDKLEKKHDREVAQLKEEHFQHLAEIELNYQLEMEQIEAELLKVKSDVEHKQGLLIAVEGKAASAQNDAHAELIGLEKDKLDLETNLESRDRQLKAAKHDLVRAMHVQEVKALEVVEHQKKVRQLEREIHKMMEREKRHLEAHRRETSLGADMNAKLQQQVADLNADFTAKEQAYQGQMEEMMQHVNDMQDKYKEELEHLEEKNNETLDQETAKWSSQFDKLDDRLAKSEAARQRQIELVREAQTERDESKDQVTLLEKQLSTICAERDRCEEQLHEAINLKNQLREEEMLNKRQGNQVRSLEAQLDHATRQLKAGGRERSLVPPPQPPPFPETPANLRRSTRIGSVNSQASPKSDDEFTKPYDLRSNKSSEGALSLKDIMTTPGPEGRYLSRLSFAGSLGPTPRKSPSASSTRSSMSHQPESATTERSRSMRLSISSTSSQESTQSNSAPFVSGALFSMEDEPTEFEWDRLSELQRRNTLCLPHLKSSYPTEVQTVKPKKISEMNLQKGEPLMTPVMEATETRSKSRKRTSTELSDDNNLNSRRKTFAGPMLAKSSTSTLNGSSGVTLKVYPHYSPHLGNTPKHKLARSSPRGTTPSKKPSTPTGTALKGPTPKGTTPKRGKSRKGSTPKPATPKTQSKKSENASPKPKKTPMSFSIGFTPKKSGRLTQFLRRKKTGDGTPKAKQQTTAKKPTLTKPLGDHNCR